MPAGSQSPHWTRISRVLVSMAVARLNDHDHIRIPSLALQAPRECGALRQDGALVEIALVGDLVGIARGWLGKDQAAGNAHRATLGSIVVSPQSLDQRLAHSRPADQ